MKNNYLQNEETVNKDALYKNRLLIYKTLIKYYQGWISQMKRYRDESKLDTIIYYEREMLDDMPVEIEEYYEISGMIIEAIDKIVKDICQEYLLEIGKERYDLK